MADQGKWFKLWVSALFDVDLRNLSLSQWARWVRLGTYMKGFGIGGVLRLSPPAKILQDLFEVTDFPKLIDAIQELPNFTIEESRNPSSHIASHQPSHETNVTVSYTITCRNWAKYQGDFSAERTRKWRKQTSPQPSQTPSHVTPQEEKRGEETKSPSPKGSSSPKAALRSAPPDAPAPLRAAVVEAGDERREYGHQDFLAMGHRSTEEPHDEFGWTHLANSLTNIERVQSKLREKDYAERLVQSVPGGNGDVF